MFTDAIVTFETQKRFSGGKSEECTHSAVVIQVNLWLGAIHILRHSSIHRLLLTHNDIECVFGLVRSHHVTQTHSSQTPHPREY